MVVYIDVIATALWHCMYRLLLSITFDMSFPRTTSFGQTHELLPRALEFLADDKYLPRYPRVG